MRWLKTREKRDLGAELELFVRAGRAADVPPLTAEARTRIVNEALRPARSEGLRTLFTPSRRLLVAGALPAVLGVALLVGLDPGVQPPLAVGENTPEVAVSKIDGRVLFDIKNGGKAHTVYRTTDPRDLSDGRGVRVTGGFEDGLQDQADLVFYRID